MATVMDHNALRGDPLLHHQSRLSQKERVAGVQLTPIIRSLSDPRASCPWCACNTSLLLRTLVATVCTNIGVSLLVWRESLGGH